MVIFQKTLLCGHGIASSKMFFGVGWQKMNSSKHWMVSYNRACFVTGEWPETAEKVRISGRFQNFGGNIGRMIDSECASDIRRKSCKTPCCSDFYKKIEFSHRGLDWQRGIKNGGERGIRTPGRVWPLRRFSKPFLSATQASLRWYPVTILHYSFFATLKMFFFGKNPVFFRFYPGFFLENDLTFFLNLLF